MAGSMVIVKTIGVVVVPKITKLTKAAFVGAAPVTISS